MTDSWSSHEFVLDNFQDMKSDGPKPNIFGVNENTAKKKDYEDTCSSYSDKSNDSCIAEMEWTDDEESDELLQAQKDEYENRIQGILQANISVNERDNLNFMPLHLALLFHEHEVIEALLQLGACTSDKTLDEHSPLYLAIMNRCITCVRLLASYKADVNEVLCIGRSFSYPLHLAVEYQQLQVVEMLLKYRANPNLFDKLQETPLHLACRIGHLEMVRLLLKNGAQDMKNIDGFSALLMALQFGHKKIFELMVGKNVNLEERYFDDYTILHLAVGTGGVDFVKILLKNKNVNINAISRTGCSSLHVAVIENNDKVADLLVNSGADINGQDVVGRAPLHLAVERRKPNISRFLLQKGAQADVRDLKLQTPLHLAAKSDCEATMRLLMEYGADVNALDFEQHTPLHIAIAAGSYRILDALFDQNIDVNAVSSSGLTPLHTAVLFERTRATGTTHGYVAKLLSSEVDVDTRTTKSGHTALHLALETGNSVLVEMLLRYGAQANILEPTMGLTPLHLAVMSDSSDCVRHLLRYSANADWQDSKGINPVDLAMSKNSNVFNEYLVKTRVAGLKTNLQSTDVECDDSFEANCVEEVKKMKQFEIFSGVTFYQFLHSSRKRLCNLVANESIAGIFKNSIVELRKDFPIYADILERNFIVGERYGRLMEPASRSLNAIARSVVPEIQNMILELLNHRDMKNLITAVTIE